MWKSRGTDTLSVDLIALEEGYKQPYPYILVHIPNQRVGSGANILQFYPETYKWTTNLRKKVKKKGETPKFALVFLYIVEDLQSGFEVSDTIGLTSTACTTIWPKKGQHDPKIP